MNACFRSALAGVVLFLCTVAFAQNKQETQKPAGEGIENKMNGKPEQVPHQLPATAGVTGPVQAPGASDRGFLKTAAISNHAEVELGKLAEQKASDSEVKSFAQRMVNDHSQAENKLKSVASDLKVGFPVELTLKYQNQKVDLSKLNGAKFDDAYMLTMVENHKTAVQLFSREAEHGHNEKIQQYAQQTLPTLKSHLKEAQQVEAKLKSTSAQK